MSFTPGRRPFCSIWLGWTTPDRGQEDDDCSEIWSHADLTGVLTTANSDLHTKEFADGRAHKAAVSLYTVHKLQFWIQPHIQVLPVKNIKNNAPSQSYLMG